MARGSLKKRWWIKLWTHQWLEGTLRFDLDPAERSIWADLLALANECRVPGIIQSGEGFPFPHSYLANRFNIPLELFDNTLVKLKVQVRISENSDGITIINWSEYQGSITPEEESKTLLKPRDEDSVSPHGALTEPSVSPHSLQVKHLQSLPSWGQSGSNDDFIWLAEFMVSYPNFSLEDLRQCRDYYSSKKKAGDKGDWKNRLRNWAKKAKQLEIGGLTDGKARASSRRLPESYKTPEQIRAEYEAEQERRCGKQQSGGVD